MRLHVGASNVRDGTVLTDWPWVLKQCAALPSLLREGSLCLGLTQQVLGFR